MCINFVCACTCECLCDCTAIVDLHNNLHISNSKITSKVYNLYALKNLSCYSYTSQCVYIIHMYAYHGDSHNFSAKDLDTTNKMYTQKVVKHTHALSMLDIYTVDDMH